MGTRNAEPAPPAKKSRLEDLPELEARTYTPQRVLGKGSFGVVYQGQIIETGETVAIKSIKAQSIDDRSWKQYNGDHDREVQILKELRGHPNIVCLRSAFLSEVGTPSSKLNMVLEFLSDSLHRVLKHHNQTKKLMDHFYVKLYSFQLCRGLAFVHGRGIIHCDVKPQNLLLDGLTHTLKICDFGTARRLAFQKRYVPYACSRYYRAPELVLGTTRYTTSVDLWSAGCVFGEMFLGQPLFTGSDGVNQLVEIIKVLGTPSAEDLVAMNPNYPPYQFKPALAAHPWEKVFRYLTKREGNEFIGSFLLYNPSRRLSAHLALLHSIFDDLRANAKVSALFDLRSDESWWYKPEDLAKLLPASRTKNAGKE